MKRFEFMKQFFCLAVFLIGLQSIGAESAEIRYRDGLNENNIAETGIRYRDKLNDNDIAEAETRYRDDINNNNIAEADIERTDIERTETEADIERTDIRTCGIVNSEHNLKEGKLSDTWAQELIGSDLLRAELEEIPPPSQANFISIFDTNFMEHAHNVRHLISGPTNYAVLPELGDKISVFQTIVSPEYLRAASQLKENGTIPSFINNSIHWFQEEQIWTSFKSLSPSSILVTISGNYFPNVLDAWKSKASLDFNAIIVGSFSPDGFVSEFSQEGEEVWILAPSDDYISSLDSYGKHNQFGGTSGAAPLVTGTLAGFEWISSYHPSAYEAKILLEKTAIKTLHSYENPQKNGVGLLNSYKIARLGKRLKEKCLSEEEDLLCFKREIQKDENYYFPPDEFLKPSIIKAFPDCAHKLKGGDVLFSVEPLNTTLEGKLLESLQNTCAEKKAAFLRLRRSLFLTPDRRDLWETLSCIYSRAGFSQNSHALDKLGQSSQLSEENLDVLLLEFKSSLLESIYDPDSEFAHWRDIYDLRFARLLIRLLSENGRAMELEHLFFQEDSYLRLAMIEEVVSLGNKLPINIIGLLDKFKEDENKNIRIRVADIAGIIGGEEGFQLLRPMVKDENKEVRMRVAQFAKIIGSEKGLSLLRPLVEDENRRVRVQVAVSAGIIGGEGGLSLLKLMAKDKSKEVRVMVAKYAGEREIREIRGGEEGLSLLRPLIEDENRGVRVMVAVSAGMIGGEEGLSLLRLMREDKSEEVRVQVAVSAGMIGGEGGLGLLRLMMEDKSEEVRVMVAKYAGEIGGEGGLSLLKLMAEDESKDVRVMVARSSFWIGNFPAMSLFESICRQKDFLIKQELSMNWYTFDQVRELCNKQLLHKDK